MRYGTVSASQSQSQFSIQPPPSATPTAVKADRTNYINDDILGKLKPLGERDDWTYFCPSAVEAAVKEYVADPKKRSPGRGGRRQAAVGGGKSIGGP